MATSGTRIGNGRGAAAGKDGASPAPEFDRRDHAWARQVNARLYWQIEREQVSFDHIAKAWWIGNNPAKQRVSRKERRASRFLEYEARRKFEGEKRHIVKDYWEARPWAACALTSDGCVHSVMNITEPELVRCEDLVHQLCRDARRAFDEVREPSRTKELMEVGEMLYVVLTRIIYSASIFEKQDATSREKSDALDAVRIQWKNTQASVEEMIQRQARFEYFKGVGLGAVITIPLLAVIGWATVTYGLSHFAEPGEPGSFTAAIIGGAFGAVISVTQRMTTRTRTPLMIDFTAPKLQKIAFGALRPIVGAVFGAVVYFAVIGGLLAVHAKTGKDASVALAFFAVVGFAAGFSERFATDVLSRASSGITPTAQGREDAEKPGDISRNGQI